MMWLPPLPNGLHWTQVLAPLLLIAFTLYLLIPTSIRANFWRAFDKATGTYYYPSLRYRITYPYNDYETQSQQTEDLLLLKSDDDQSRFIDESVASLGMTSGALSGGHSMGEVIDDLSDSLSEQMSFDRCTSRRGSKVDPSDISEDDANLEAIASLSYPLEDVINLLASPTNPSPEDYLNSTASKKIKKLQWRFCDERCGTKGPGVDSVHGVAVICHSTDGGKYAILFWKDGCIKWVKARRLTLKEKEGGGSSLRKKLGFGSKKISEWDEETSPGSFSQVNSNTTIMTPTSSSKSAAFIPSFGCKVHSINYESVVALDKGANTPPFKCKRNVDGERCFSVLTEDGSLDLECFKGERDVVVTGVMEVLKKARGESSGMSLEAV